MKKIFLLAVAAIGLFSSCKKDKDDHVQGIFKGPEVQVFNGKAFSWIEVDKTNKPLAIGVTISQSAFNSLPTNGEGHHGFPFVLKLPTQKNVTPFDHVGMDWNPHGHEPEHIYGHPHFDFHFYMLPETERMQIPIYENAPAKFDNAPGAGYMPVNYMNFGGGVPQMGAHWLDITSPELNQQNPATFTQTFIYGSYDSKVIFMEPMITKKFIEDNNSFTRDIPQPQKFQKSGYYPTRMHLKKHHGETNIVMDGFVFREQS